MIDSLEFSADGLKLETAQGVEEITVEPLESPYFDRPMIEDFAAAARSGRAPICDGLTGLKVQAVVDAAFASGRYKKTVPVEACRD